MLTSKVSFRQRMRNYRRHPGSFILFLLMSLAALIAAVAVGGITTGVWLYKRREQE